MTRRVLILLLLAYAIPASAQLLQTGGQEARFGQHSLRGPLDQEPHTVDVVSGGGAHAGIVSNECRGYISRVPHVILRLESPGALLRLFAESEGDTTLVVHTPSDQWFCNDDAVDLHPMVDIASPPPGQYEVWIGNYDRRANQSARLTVTGNASLRPGSNAPPPSPAPPATQEGPAAPYTFSGEFEQLSVSFAGETLDELYQACVSFVQGAGLERADDIRVANGQRYHNRPSYWDIPSMCSIAVLNANASGHFPARVTGNVEGSMFFYVSGPSEAAVAEIIATHLPAAITHESRIDNIVINEERHEGGRTVWSPAEVVAMVNAAIVTTRR